MVELKAEPRSLNRLCRCRGVGEARLHLSEIMSLENHLAGLLKQPLSMLLAVDADDSGHGLIRILSDLQEFKESQGQPEDPQELLGRFNFPQPAVGPT